MNLHEGFQNFLKNDVPILVWLVIYVLTLLQLKNKKEMKVFQWHDRKQKYELRGLYLADHPNVQKQKLLPSPKATPFLNSILMLLQPIKHLQGTQCIKSKE